MSRNEVIRYGILHNRWRLTSQSLNCSSRLQEPECWEESLHLFVWPVAVSPCCSKMSVCIRGFCFVFFAVWRSNSSELMASERQRLVIWDVGRIAAFSAMLLVRQEICSELPRILSLTFQYNHLGWTANLSGSTIHSKNKSGLFDTRTFKLYSHQQHCFAYVALS